ncbi:Piso0_001610 [Millerozyma farinosa CBS 7064]|uniref:Piso0_001610 protein n=1 Tax=Pichia sorbitophila (strain ATCC MYA-4447 / BCRC 22081 / CBS 7064 / NBRC 10061 / NRRL Y-12695) TaxID=559304 RepID=G8YL90_PICSO|nr:Piso0_001610 [Millerozyma farinosa CBS 7064]
MSDKEEHDDALNRDEEVDDLFGEDSEGEKVDEEKIEQSEEEDENKQGSTAQETRGGHDDDEENEDSAEEDFDFSSERKLKNLDISIPRHAVLPNLEPSSYVMKMPVFLNVDAHPFDASEFKETVKQNAVDRSNRDLDEKQMQNDLVAEKLLNENTIRWRYSNRGDDEIIKQSNAHFVQWDDGSLSLKIGNELFDFKELPLYDNLLVKSHDDHEILQVDSTIKSQVNLIPSSTFTDTHRKLTQAVKNIQRKDKILNTVTDTDPMLIQRIADENEKKSLKLKRQLEMKRRLQEEKMERTGSSYQGNSYEPSYERFERTYGDDYDEEDDFIANEEEEEEEEEEGDAEEEEEDFERGAERLQKLKEEGSSKYQKNSDEEKDEVASSDEQATQRKRRRIIDSEDEDEE